MKKLIFRLRLRSPKVSKTRWLIQLLGFPRRKKIPPSVIHCPKHSAVPWEHIKGRAAKMGAYRSRNK